MLHAEFDQNSRNGESRCLNKILRVMKIAAFLLLAASLHLSATGLGQRTITLKLENANLKKVFYEIRKQTGYDFFYDDDLIKNALKVSIEVKDASITETLDLCFKSQAITYTISGLIITLKPRVVPPGNTSYEIQAAPELDIRGVIKDENGVPIEGVSVMVKGTNKGSYTNANGEFSIKVPDENAKLIVTSIGYEPKVVDVNGTANITIQLAIAVKGLDQAMAIGYGKTSQRYSVGSVSKVTAEEISRQPVSNPLAALQGRVPGLVVSATSGLPGASYNIQIRGQNTLSPDPTAIVFPKDNPLFIIDGVPFAPQNAGLNQYRSIAAPGNAGSLNNPYGNISPFTSINPADIESIEVLRDADATAIYGSRGANGVILITTKKGKVGESKLNFSIQTGASSVARSMPLMNTRQYLEMRREAFQNDAIVPNTTAGTPGYAPDLLVFDSTKYTDWKEYFIGGTANTIDVNGSVAGGSSGTQFFIGAGYHNEKTFYHSSFGLRSGSVNLNLSHRSPNKKLFVSLSANYSSNENKLAETPDLLTVFSLSPNYPDLTDQQGNLVWDYKGIDLGGAGLPFNPMGYIMRKYTMNTDNLISRLQFNYNIIPGLMLKSSFGYNRVNSNEYSGNPAAAQDPGQQRIATANFGTSKLNSWIIEPQVEYVRKLLGGRLTVLLGSTFQQNKSVSTDIYASGYNNDGLIGSISAAPNKTVSDRFLDYKYNAIFGRINYVVNNKYILNINGRRDGSSRFGPGKQFGNFGSLGVGWIFSEEKFVKSSLPALSYGKLRGSYGTAGTDGIPDYQYVARWQTTSYPYQGSLGYYPLNPFNADFGWAETKKFEVGLELGLFKNRILANTTWYRHRTDNQLVYYPLPIQTGFNNVIENWNAVVQNSGLEIVFTSKNIQTKNFNWSSSINLTIARNRLVSFPGIEATGYASKLRVGEPTSVLIKYHYLGINDTTGIFQFENSQKVPTYNPVDADMEVVGNSDPKFYGGMENSFTYRGFELDVFFEFRNQTGMNYLGQVYANVAPGMALNQPTSFLTRWQKPGDKSAFQKFTSQATSQAGKAALQYFVRSDGVYSDASFIRCKNVSLSYSIPQKYLKKIRTQNCNIYLNMQNLFTITNYKGNDPETQSYYGLPVLRTVVAGIKFTL